MLFRSHLPVTNASTHPPIHTHTCKFKNGRGTYIHIHPPTKLPTHHLPTHAYKYDKHIQQTTHSCTHLHIYTHIYIYTNTYIYILSPTKLPTHVPTYLRTHTHCCTHPATHSTHIHVYQIMDGAHTYIHSPTNLPTHVPTYLCTHTHCCTHLATHSAHTCISKNDNTLTMLYHTLYQWASTIHSLCFTIHSTTTL